MARCSLLLGACTGNSITNYLHIFYNYLEIRAIPNVQVAQLPLVLLVLFSVVTFTNGDCNSYSIIASELKSCEALQDGSKTCQMFTTAEITLTSISAENCLYFTDRKSNQLFSLKIKLNAISCHFSTERMYFTFPVQAKHISQISCAFNKYCGRGTHCIKQRIGKDGLRFESETAESRTFPGISSCIPGGPETGCLTFNRAACNFYRTWYEPDLLHTYEVSAIRNYKCKYNIEITHMENDTISKITVSDSMYTDKGIKISILGAYDQPQTNFDDYLIQRIGITNEAYLAPASHRNHPKAGQIGSVQANTSFTKDFIFDPDLSTCDFFEDILRCTDAPDALQLLRNSKEMALPLQRGGHLLRVRDGKLTSSLLMSSAVRVQLNFQNYKIEVKSITVCPQFSDSDITTLGCYNCHLFARMTFTAHSTCQKGLVTVQFQEISVFTKAVELNTEPHEITIKFLAEAKCYQEKLCLHAKTNVQCRTFSFCLEEPSVELINLNLNYTHTQSADTPSNWWDIFRIPNINSTLFMLKFASSALLLVCLSITIITTLITCLCRAR